ERFVRVENGRVTTQPIKGTRRRGRTDAEDAALALELRNSEKDRAENLMIVDLLRNDLGKCCKPGSIRVEKLFELQSFPNVHHLVSTVTGELRGGVSPLAFLKAAFPGGSITGAPKVRAMEIIHELEPHERGPYCGAIGYYSYNGNLDTNLSIRTLVYKDGSIYYWGGGGIVADSVAADEYAESLAKVDFIRRALGPQRDRSSAAAQNTRW
ncbi:MAG: anthranilate synthase component I family protein, partial [Pseudomonadales bacterium]